MPRRPSSIEYEGHRALLSLAGIRQIKQTNISALATSDTTYTVTEANTRRVVVIFLGGTADGDIRFDYNAAAASTDFPLLRSKYIVIDAEKNDVLHFFNTTAGAITVFLMEIE